MKTNLGSNQWGGSVSRHKMSLTPTFGIFYPMVVSTLVDLIQWLKFSALLIYYFFPNLKNLKKRELKFRRNCGVTTVMCEVCNWSNLKWVHDGNKNDLQRDHAPCPPPPPKKNQIFFIEKSKVAFGGWIWNYRGTPHQKWHLMTGSRTTGDAPGKSDIWWLDLELQGTAPPCGQTSWKHYLPSHYRLWAVNIHFRIAFLPSVMCTGQSFIASSCCSYLDYCVKNNYPSNTFAPNDTCFTWK